MQCFHPAHHCFPGAGREQLRQEGAAHRAESAPGLPRDRNPGLLLLLLLRMGLPSATPSLWVRLWQNRVLLLGITAGRAGKECPGVRVGFGELRDRHVCR